MTTADFLVQMSWTSHTIHPLDMSPAAVFIRFHWHRYGLRDVCCGVGMRALEDYNHVLLAFSVYDKCMCHSPSVLAETVRHTGRDYVS